MKTVSLISPPLTPRERYGPLGQAGVYMPPLGIGYIASIARNSGMGVQLLDCEALEMGVDETVDAVAHARPDIIGISAVTCSIHRSGLLAEALKKVLPNVPILLGGSHITALPERTMNAFPALDIGVLGEAELTVAELFPALLNGGRLDNINGLIFRRNGELVKTPERPLIADLDTLPLPAWDLYPDLATRYRPSVFGFKRLPATSLVTSRGCPFKCSFCAQTPWKDTYREHSAEYVLEMIRKLRWNYGIKEFIVYDEIFGLTKKRLFELLHGLEKEKLDISWSCNLRVHMAEPEILKLMKKTGCWGVAFGIESGSPEVLRFTRKGTNPPMIVKGLENADRAGMVTKGYLMVGTLNETKESVKETLSFVLKLDLDLITVNAFTPFPGTLDYERASHYGTFDDDWRRINEHEVVFTPKEFTVEDVEYWRRLITMKFYFRPKIFVRHLMIFANVDSFKIIFSGLLVLLSFVSDLLRFRKSDRSWLKIPRANVIFSGDAIRKALKAIFTGKVQDHGAVRRFEDEFASYIGARQAIAVGSGTIALRLILKAIGVGEGDEVLLPSYTVKEVAAAVHSLKAEPVYVDIDPSTFSIDPALVEARISPRTKCVLMTHLYGRAGDVPAIVELAQKHKIALVEDCCQSCGGEYQGKRLGTFGVAGYYSLGSMKNLNALSGGVIVTNNEGLASALRDEVKAFQPPKTLGLIWLFFKTLGVFAATRRSIFTVFISPVISLLSRLNERMVYSLFEKPGTVDSIKRDIMAGRYDRAFSGLQAVIALDHLGALETQNAKRARNAATLSRLLNERGHAIQFPGERDGYKDVHTQYVVTVQERAKVKESLRERGIDSTEGYLVSFEERGFGRQLAEKNLYLPLYPSLQESDLIRIADAFTDAVKPVAVPAVTAPVRQLSATASHRLESLEKTAT